MWGKPTHTHTHAGKGDNIKTLALCWFICSVEGTEGRRQGQDDKFLNSFRVAQGSRTCTQMITQTIVLWIFSMINWNLWYIYGCVCVLLLEYSFILWQEWKIEQKRGRRLSLKGSTCEYIKIDGCVCVCVCHHGEAVVVVVVSCPQRCSVMSCLSLHVTNEH